MKLLTKEFYDIAVQNITQKLIENHLVDGKMEAGEEIGLKIDQALLQDATGTLVQLELEATGSTADTSISPSSVSCTITLQSSIVETCLVPHPHKNSFMIVHWIGIFPPGETSGQLAVARVGVFSCQFFL